jgi:hypothetical protein
MVKQASVKNCNFNTTVNFGDVAEDLAEALLINTQAIQEYIRLLRHQEITALKIETSLNDTMECK